jgi:DNA polymerase-3 subunit beta
MQLTCNRAQLLQALTELQTVVQSRTVAPELSCVLLRASETELVLTGTNTALTLHLTIPCNARYPGTALVQQRLLTEWLKLTPGETVELKLKDTKLEVKVMIATKMQAKCTLAAYPDRDFPNDDDVADALVNNVAITLPLELERALRLTAVATLDDTSDPRANLHALTFVFAPYKLTIYATDSFRLALQELSTDIDTDFTCMLLVKGVQTNLLSLLKQIETDSQIKFYNLPNQVIFQLSCKNYSAILAMQKVAGLPLNVLGLIPKDVEVSLTVERLVLVNAIQAAQVFGRDNHNRVYLTLDATTALMTISSLNSQTGTHENELPIYGMAGATKLHLVLNAVYLLEYLKASTAELLLISKRASDRSPLILQDADRAEQGLYLMMPIVV